MPAPSKAVSSEVEPVKSKAEAPETSSLAVQALEAWHTLKGTVDDKTPVQQTLRNLTDTTWFVKQEKAFGNGLKVTPDYDGAYTLELTDKARIFYRIDSDGKTVHLREKPDSSADDSIPKPPPLSQEGTASVGPNGELVLDMQENKDNFPPAGKIIITRDGSIREVEKDKEEKDIKVTDYPAHGEWSRFMRVAEDGTATYVHLTLMSPKSDKKIGALDGTAIVFQKDGSLKAERINDYWRPEKGSTIWTLDPDGTTRFNKDGSEYRMFKKKTDAIKSGEVDGVIYPDHADYCRGKVGGFDISQEGSTKVRSGKQLRLELPEYKNAKLTVAAYQYADTGEVLTADIEWIRKRQDKQ